MIKKTQRKSFTHHDPRAELERVNRALRGLTTGKQVVLHARDEASLLTEMCRAVGEAGGYRMAWVGYAAQDKRKSVLPKAHWGGAEDYLERIKASWAETAEGGTPVGAAIRTGMPVAVEDIRVGVRFGRWRRIALRHRYGSCVCLPLKLDDTVVGALALYKAEPTAFGSETLRLLCETAGDLAFGITNTRRQAEHDRVIRSLRESEARYRAARDGSLDAFSMLKSVRDAAGRLVDFEFVEVNRHAEEMLGVPRGKLVGRRHSEFLPGIKADGLLENYFQVVNTGKALEEDVRVRMPSGKVWWLRHQLVPLGDGLAVSARDVTLRKQMELDLRQSLATLAAAEQLAQLGTWSFDVSSGIISSSAGLSRLFGLPAQESRRPVREILEFFPPQERQGLRGVFSSMASANRAFRQERRILHKGGKERVLLFHGEPTLDEAGGIVSFAGFAQDITERKQNEAHIEYLATHDALTALPNRTVLSDRVSQAIAHAERRKGERLAVLRVDLDRFAVLIGGLGHSFGDEVIKAVAARIQARMREGDTLASLGGDDFVVLLQYVRRPEDVLRVARRLQEAFTESFLVRRRKIYATCSIGASLYPDDGKDTETLLKNADAALQRVQAGGGNGFQFYTPDLGEWASQRVQMEAALRRALDKAEFELRYQPQVDLKSGRICGVEALIRWRHPEMGLVSPARFIPLAEETGLIIPIGEWVLKAACEQNRRWQRAGLPRLRMAVNVSAKQFARGDIERSVAAMRNRGDFEPGELELEVTEGVVMHDIVATRARLKRLQSLG
ncbi:MAG TPA: diguanylate cyclase, partial [Candidatus Binataceae bacterium]|nr:diguanylate cyclase [Candidatus Binataceae bacterium]